MRSLQFASAIIAIALGFAATPTHANTLFTFGPGEPDTVNTSFTINIGTAVTIGPTALTATHIGAFVGADVANGVTTTAFLANIYDGTNANLLSSTPIPVGTPVNSQDFAYVPLTTTLNANAPYWLTDVAVDSNNNALTTPFAYNGSGAPAGTWHDATPIVPVFVFNPSPATQAPNQINAGFVEFMGANVQFTPEPSSFILCGLGGIGLFVASRRRKN